MPEAAEGPAAGFRAAQVRRALRLVTTSVAFGLISGAVSVASGLHAHSLGVLAVGLGVLADVTGSATLIWRFRAELSQPVMSARRERQSAVIVALALASAAAVLTAESVLALAQGTHPEPSVLTVTAAGISLVVLTPLAIAKRRLGKQINSRALQGDGTLSGIGAATSFLALAALVCYLLLGWWWADRATAVVVAVIAAREALHTAPGSRRQRGASAGLAQARPLKGRRRAGPHH